MGEVSGKMSVALLVGPTDVFPTEIDLHDPNFCAGKMKSQFDFSSRAECA